MEINIEELISTIIVLVLVGTSIFLFMQYKEQTNEISLLQQRMNESERLNKNDGSICVEWSDGGSTLDLDDALNNCQAFDAECDCPSVRKEFIECRGSNPKRYNCVKALRSFNIN